MCGRTVCHQAPSCICRAAGRRSGNGKWSQPSWRDPPGGQKYYPSYNQAPTSYTPIMMSRKHLSQTELELCSDLTDIESPVTDDNGAPLEKEESDFVVQPMQWGLVPSWHKGDPKAVGYNMINARSDSILEKRSFSVPLEKGRRCVALIDGYYEWQNKDGDKQPFFIFKKTEVKSEVKDEKPGIKDEKPDVKDEKLEVKDEKQEVKDDNPEVEVKVEFKSEDSKPMLKVAGLFDVWKSSEGEPLYTFSMITVDAHKDMSWIHHRMPALLQDEEEVQAWLNFNEVPLKKAVDVIRPNTNLSSHPVDKAVGNVHNKSSDLIKAIDPKKPKKTASSNFMSAWLNKGKPKLEKEASGRKRSLSESECIAVNKHEVKVQSEVKEEGDEPTSAKRLKSE